MASPSPLKTSTLPNSPGLPTSPLRIAKRDSPQPRHPSGPSALASQRPGQPAGSPLARRQSSSYAHLRRNNLVSKSPFKSQIPSHTAPRKVSGEKRARPLSLQQQAEKERPTGYRRRQSNGIQHLESLEPVSKSPFKREASEEHDEHPPPVPPKHSIPVTVPIHERTQSLPVPLPTPERSSVSPNGTPTRSALVSRRLLGPRGAAGRVRRKTVTFDERCDVVEFDRASCETDSLVFDSGGSEDEYYGEDYEAEQMRAEYEHGISEYQQQEHHDAPEQEVSFDAAADDSLFGGAADDSIVGLVDSMLQDNHSTVSADISVDVHRPRTPTQEEPFVPEDMEGGVPYGRSHHASRAALAHQHHVPPLSPITPPADVHFFPHSEGNVTPTNYTSAPDVHREPGSQLPLGRTTHAERIMEARAIEREVDALPASPSPRKAVAAQGRMAGLLNGLGGLVPKFGLDLGRGESTPPIDNPHAQSYGYHDPFALAMPEIPRIKQELADDPELSFTSEPDLDLDTANLAPSVDGVGGENTSLSLSALEAELGLGEGSQSSDQHQVDDDGQAPPPVHDDTQHPSGGSPILTSVLAKLGAPFARPASPSPARSASPLPLPGRIGFSAPGRAGSPLARPDSPPQPSQESTQSSLSSTNGGRPSSLSSSTTLASTASGSTRPTSYDSIGSRAGSASPGGSVTGRRSPRISREDVKMRLMKKRSLESPLRELGPQEVGLEVEVRRVELEVHEDSRRRVNSATAALNVERLSVMTTGSTGSDLRDATIEHVEKTTLAVRPAHVQQQSHDGVGVAADSLERPKLRARAATVDSVPDDRRQSRAVPLEEMKSALDQFMDDVASDVGSVVSGASDKDTAVQGLMRLEAVTQGVTAGTFGVPVPAGESMDIDLEDSLRAEVEGADQEEDQDDGEDSGSTQAPQLAPIPSVTADVRADSVTSPPAATSAHPPPPKITRKAREEAILEKRREARRRDEDQMMGFTTPPRDARPLNTSIRRPKPRRSMSAGDAEAEADQVLLDVSSYKGRDDPLAETIGRALRRLDGPSKTKYHVREREETIYAADELGVSRSTKAGEPKTGNAWRPVKRPSDMNEYSKQIKAFRAQGDNTKAHGKVFVKVVGVRAMNLPFPKQPTAMTCTLNNGIHYVSTPECRLARDMNIEQEFELIEHSKLEFTLTLKIRRDPHIMAQLNANTPPPPRPTPPPEPAAPPPPPASKGGMRSFFKSSPKKQQRIALRPATPQPPPPQPQWRLEENLGRYLKTDGTLARAFVSFKDVAHRCDTRLFEIALPLIGQHSELGGKISTLQVGELILELFRLPPLPVPADQLPQSLEECHRGLRHVAWHKVTYFEGTLTQNGGDCTSWRRRHLRIIGASLIAFNDVTKKPIATIDLRKAVAVEDDQQSRDMLLSPESGSTGRSSRFVDEFDGPSVERSFRLIFPDNQEIVFFADTDDEKSRWLEILRALVGHIPPNPLWAELLWARQQDIVQQQPTAAHLQGPASPRPAAHQRIRSAAP